jgi:predicted nucleic acid-binding protein
VGDIVIFDTDIFIWIQRGNLKAAAVVDGADSRYLSIQSYMELLQGAHNKTQHKLTKKYISDLGFIVLPFTENIGHRALIYVEEYTLSSGLYSADAVIAATAIENNMRLCSSNEKHFKAIKELDFQSFKP